MDIRIIGSNATLKTTSSKTFIDVKYGGKYHSWKLVLKNGKPTIRKLFGDDKALDID